MELQLSGKRVLITGGSQGIGLAVAKGFAAEGANLHLVSRSKSKLEAAKQQVSAIASVDIQIHPYDLSDSKSIDELVLQCPDIDILVNNAGAVPGGDILATDEETWRRAWDLKIFGYINMARAFYRAMQDRGGGVIVNVIGAAGDRPGYNFLAGASGNAALMAFTRGLGSRSIDEGVRVVAVSPGGVETPRMVTLAETRAKRELGDPSRWRELSGDLPLGRPAKAEEVADLVVFLSSERASYVNATVVTIDGGNSYR
jgi:NAD(P)-dependent dehydrogenase (short-subunit alcohol dehydrogenase family)